MKSAKATAAPRRGAAHVDGVITSAMVCTLHHTGLPDALSSCRRESSNVSRSACPRPFYQTRADRARPTTRAFFVAMATYPIAINFPSSPTQSASGRVALGIYFSFFLFFVLEQSV